MTTRCLGTRHPSAGAGRRALGLAALVACSSLLHARAASADGAPPASTSSSENVVVLPPLTGPSDAAAGAANGGVPAASPELVVPLDETRRARAKRLRVRPYSGGGVPSGMHVEDRYGTSQKVPLYVGIPVFVGSYGLAALFAVSGRGGDRPVNGKLLVPVLGAFLGAADEFQEIGNNHGYLSGLADVIYAFAGFFAVVDGAAQAGGLVLTGVGITKMSQGPQPHLVPDESAVHVPSAEPLRVAVRPVVSVGGVPATGVGLTIAGF